jgi:tetratricopeptide (TPR) repeat protein
LDTADTDAHSVLSQISQFRNFVEADGHCRAALASAPADAMAHGAYAGVLANVGHLREALAEARKSYALAPANGTAVQRLVQALSMNGLDTEAANSASIARTMAGPNVGLTSLKQVEFRLALKERRLEAATDALVKIARGAIDRSSLALIVAAMADPAQRPAASAVKSHFYPKVSAPKLGVQIPQQWIADSAATCTAAYAYATAGMLDEAFDLANRCLPAPMGIVVGSMWAPESAAFRRDPRFSGYVDRFGRHLIDYWQKYGPPDNCELRDRQLTCH